MLAGRLAGSLAMNQGPLDPRDQACFYKDDDSEREKKNTRPSRASSGSRSSSSRDDGGGRRFKTRNHPGKKGDYVSPPQNAHIAFYIAGSRDYPFTDHTSHYLEKRGKREKEEKKSTSLSPLGSFSLIPCHHALYLFFPFP